MENRTGIPSGSLISLFRELCATRYVLFGGPVEEVVGRVRYKLLGTNVCRQGAARRRCKPAGSVEPLHEGGVRQRVAAGGPVLGSILRLRNQEPGYGAGRDKSGVCGGVAIFHLAPEAARVLGVLPCDANRATLRRVGAEEVGDDLLTVVVEQRRLRRKEFEGDLTDAIT